MTDTDEATRLAMCARIRSLTEQLASMTRANESLQKHIDVQNDTIETYRKSAESITAVLADQKSVNESLHRTLTENMDQNKTLIDNNTALKAENTILTDGNKSLIESTQVLIEETKKLRMNFQSAVSKIADYELRDEEMRISMASLHAAFLDHTK